MKKSTALFISGIILLLTAMSLMSVWFYACLDETLTFEQTKALYLSYLPAWLRYQGLPTLITIALLTGAATCFYLSSSTKQLSVASYILGALSTLLFCWNVFSLM